MSQGDTMPSTYETSQPAQSGSNIGFHPEYLRTVPGILKVVEVVLDLIVFICACIGFWWGEQSWVEFVAISAFLSTLVYLLLHLLNLISRFPGPWLLIEFIYYCIFTAFYLIAAIVAAAKGSLAGSIAACSFFAFAATAVYGVDTFFQFRAWRTGQAAMGTTTTTTTTTTAHNVEAGGQQY